MRLVVLLLGLGVLAVAPADAAGYPERPVRLVVPHLYFWKSAKWLQSIEFLAEDAPGYWEVRGYHNRGDPWAEQRYSGD